MNIIKFSHSGLAFIIGIVIEITKLNNKDPNVYPIDPCIRMENKNDANPNIINKVVRM